MTDRDSQQPQHSEQAAASGDQEATASADNGASANGVPYRFDETRGYCTLALLPRINDAQWGEIEEYGTKILETLENPKSKSFLLDLTALNYIGSALVALIVRLWKSAEQRQGRMVVVNNDSTVYEVLEIAGLTNLWSIVDTRDEAVDELEGTTVKRVTKKALSILWPLGGILAVVGAALGLTLLLESTGTVQKNIAVSVQFSCLALGLIAGTLSAVRSHGIWRGIGFLLILASIIIGVVGALNLS